MTIAVVANAERMMRLMTADSNNTRLAFTPRPDFIPDCPPVCANCKHWRAELFAWGNVRICRVKNEPRDCGQVCNVYRNNNDED